MLKVHLSNRTFLFFEYFIFPFRHFLLFLSKPLISIFFSLFFSSTLVFWVMVWRLIAITVTARARIFSKVHFLNLFFLMLAFHWHHMICSLMSLVSCTSGYRGTLTVEDKFDGLYGWLSLFVFIFHIGSLFFPRIIILSKNSLCVHSKFFTVLIVRVHRWFTKSGHLFCFLS